MKSILFKIVIFIGLAIISQVALASNPASEGWVENYVAAHPGPQGPAGPQGPTGSQGPQGDPGAPKTAGAGITIIGDVISLTPHTIGESYGGGIVFYVYDNGQHG